MIVEQIYTGCLAQGAYYIESEGEAAIIDPLRETSPYIRRAEKSGAKIKYIFETHFHADFVSGHVDLAEKTGATIVYGPGAKAAYKIHEGADSETFHIGKVRIKLLHTPGHTPESTTYLLIDQNGKNHAIFSGDTLFIGDVGRPDLAVKSDLTKEDLAGLLYDSLHNKILPLEDDVIVYPAHGAGSACGKNMSKETFDLLGNQKKVNYALQPMTKAEFTEKVLDGIAPPPQYFPKNVMLNKQGYSSLDTVMEKGLVALEPDMFEEVANIEGALVLDTRKPEAFRDGYVPNSIFIGIDGSFAPWVGALITDINQPLLIVADEGREEEIVTRLARVGYDNTLGYLKGGIEAWRKAGKETETVVQVTAEELEKLMQKQPVSVVDVRKPSEYLSEHVKEAINFPLDYINEHMNDLDRNQTYHIHCAGGYRSMITISILKARGYEHIVDVAGGFKEIAKTGIAKTDYVCPSTLAK